jgi:hypothetical protein
MFSDIIRGFKVGLKKYYLKPGEYSFVMNPKEQKLFDNTIRNSLHYLEFGMGGSTLRVIQNSKARIYSVDSSRDYIVEMRKYFIIKFSVLIRRMFIFYVDIGRTKQWGYPLGLISKDLFPNYSSLVYKKIKKSKIDTVLVDGRFRVACALKTIIECYSNEVLNIMIHDFDREEYQILHRYLEEVERADTLSLFHIKKELDLSMVIADYDKFKYNPR